MLVVFALLLEEEAAVHAPGALAGVVLPRGAGRQHETEEGKNRATVHDGCL